MSLHPELVNTLTILSDLGVYVGALAVIVAMAMAIAELVGLVDRFLIERSIRQAIIRRRKTPMAGVISIRQRRKVFGQRVLEREDASHDPV